jgi:hypothetical protein
MLGFQKEVAARPESQNYGGCLVTTGTSGRQMRGKVHASSPCRLDVDLERARLC